MATILYPMGYGFALGTIDQVMAEANAHHHPEFCRRLRAWLIAQGGNIGVGDAWRATGSQPNLPGFAPEGQSFHQDQRWASGFIGGGAVDLVARKTGTAHRAPYWREVPAQGSALAKLWGLHCNVSGEPWHIQCIEYDGWYSWKIAGRKDPVKGYKLPGETTPDLWKIAPPPTLRLGVDNVYHVSLLQRICNERFGATLTTDGIFGPATEAAVKTMQKILGVVVDGVYGPQSAGALETWLARH